MPITPDYTERVYAGVLGKIIGVYLGRPFEGWSYDRIMAELGEVWYYVHEKRGTPLIVTDDDISGTFTFLRALPDCGNSRDLTPEQIGQTWLNYIIENRTILWWGGMGNSTEHTAYLRLKSGIPAPRSGSIELNGRVVAEQIGAQIFIDGWGMIAPGDPDLAADFARRAASVSHDGEAIYGAQVVAAIEAQAFVESDIERLIDTAVALIPRDSLIYRLIADLREWHGAEKDWRKTRERIAERYGYDRYGGNCHMVPNHALIIHALLHGDGDFQKSLMIVNTCGWDTDCNSGNVGCILGIRNGLAAIDSGPDWRAPVADRMYLATADGGRGITDAVTEAYRIVNIGRALAGEEPLAPKVGARFHFSMPGSVQGFRAEDSPEVRGTTRLRNVRNEERDDRTGALTIYYEGLASGRISRASTSTFIPAEALAMGGYGLIASPTLYPGQTVRAAVSVNPALFRLVDCRLYVSAYDEQDQLFRLYGPAGQPTPEARTALEWTVPPTGGKPIAEVGLEISAPTGERGAIFLDHLTWDGAPDCEFPRVGSGQTWRRAWVNGVDHFDSSASEPYRLIQDRGTGLLIQGTREWTDYRASATCKPHMVESAGIAARVQGMRRYYALLLHRSGKARLVKEPDGRTVLAECDFPWKFGKTYALALQVEGSRIRGWIDDRPVFDVTDAARPLEGGALALIVEEGRCAFDNVRVQPAS